MGNSTDRDFSRHQVIVFDWDGTVADSVALVVQSVRRAAESMGYVPPEPAVIRPLIGLSLGEMLPRFLPDLSSARHAEFIETYRRHYFGNRNQVDIPFDGIPVLLARLAEQGRRLAVATGKSRVGLDRVLKSTGLGRFFEATRCAEEGVSKPDPWMLRSLAEEMQVQPADMVMIGDSIYDIDMANAFGCDSIGVYYDTGAPDGLTRSTQPTALAATVDDLGHLLMG
ncbi:MAG: HAD-IA family hydrolase [Lautropia sp.]|nr:HAD-IA family hydrolase [Lautropia sp.]